MVKLLDEQRLVEVNSMLNYFDTGGPAVIEGSVQLYSCKLAGDSKALSKSLDQQYIKEIAAGTSAGSFADSPFSTCAARRRSPTLSCPGAARAARWLRRQQSS